MTNSRAALAALVLGALAASAAHAGWPEVREAYESGDAAALVQALAPLAEEGDPQAQYTLGILHDTGQGVAQDHAEAARWYRMAGDQSHPDALYNLALLHFEGKGVDMDREETLRLYRQAAKQGEAESLSGIGYLHQHGIAVGEDPVEAMAHFLLAAERGSVLGERNRDRLLQQIDTNDLAFARKRLDALRTEYSPQ